MAADQDQPHASSWARDESYLRNHVQPEFANLALARIDKLQVQAWVRSLVEKRLHPGTIYHCYRILRSILNDDADARLIVESPFRNVTLPRIPKTDQRFLSGMEVERLADSIDPRFRTLVYSAVYLGCRWGELVGLKWRHVRLEKREARIVGTLEEIGGGSVTSRRQRPPAAGEASRSRRSSSTSWPHSGDRTLKRSSCS